MKTIILIVSLLACACHSASEVPNVRLARALPAEAAEARARAERHNSALRTLLRQTGIPVESDQHTLELRTRALELINEAITNDLELADGSATAENIALAAADYVGRHIFEVATNSPTASYPRYSSGWSLVRAQFLASHRHCAACGSVATVVHHIVPVHVDATVELEYANLIPFCPRCHLFVGHLGDWRSWNTNCVSDAIYWRTKIESRPYAFTNTSFITY